MASVLACGRLPDRLGRAARAGLGGLWLGLLDEPQLRALDERYYARDPLYLSTGWNERGLTPWEREAAETSFAPGSRVVVLACGGGREVLALLNAGFDAVGYESHPDLLAFAKRFLAERGHSGRARFVPRDAFPADEACTGVLVGWGAYSLIAPRQRRVALLHDAARATVAGGAVILSFFERPGRGRELRMTAGLASWVRRQRGRGPIELGDALAPNRVHVFTRSELDRELAEAGLMLESYRQVAMGDETTAYVCAIARRMG
jgi:hypothetical protein